MKSEIEARFININADALRLRLRACGATLEQPDALFTRTIYENSYIRQNRGWLRLRTGPKDATMTYKQQTAEKASVSSIVEVEITVSDAQRAGQLLQAIGMQPGRTQETRRETWRYQSSVCTIDTWPLLRPFLEIEAPSEDEIRDTAKALYLDYSSARFGSVDDTYRELLGIDIMTVPNLTFGMRSEDASDQPEKAVPDAA